MNKKAMAIAISVVLLVLTVAGVLLGVYWESIQRAINGTVTYTYEDVQNAYNQGLNDGVANEQSLIKQIETYKNQLEELTEYKSLYEQLASENPELKNKITELQLQIEQLNATIKYYESILNEEDKNLVFVNFYFENELIKTVAVVPGTIVPETEIPNTYNGYNISSWLYNGEIFDLTTSEINANTDVKANVEYVNVIYIVDNQIYATNKTIKGYNLTNLPETPSKDFLTFIGWMKDGELVNPSTFIVSEEITLVAKFESYLNGSYTLKLDLISRYAIMQPGKLNSVITFDLNVADTTNVADSLSVQNKVLGEYIEDILVETVDNELSLTLMFDVWGISKYYVDSITFNFDRLQNTWSYVDFVAEGMNAESVVITVSNISLEQK